MKTIIEIQVEIERLASKIGATESQLPTYGTTRDFAFPHIEVNDKYYYYVVVERGKEISRKKTQLFDELLYWVFDSATREVALLYELNIRAEGSDSLVNQRIWRGKQLELLNRINPAMALAREREIAAIRRDHSAIPPQEPWANK